MSDRRSYHQEALETLERAMRSNGLARSCLMEEAVRLHRLACDRGEVRGFEARAEARGQASRRGVTVHAD